MNLGLELKKGTFTAYRKISKVEKVALGDAYEATLSNGDKIRFNSAENFQRIKNYLTTGHPVTDDSKSKRQSDE